ncbi:MAG: hypothetical protein RML40_09815, partial [Bacteroidota bacterium]|nr:hypothetical protein [Candidatus Kapabacteria bacterium]MDW8220814.1 hypothetical protein [Bacteroidota bacterium]
MRCRQATIACILLAAYLTLTCRVVLPVINYMVNYESYRERCENKDKPEMECDGSCQVQKEVAEASD